MLTLFLYSTGCVSQFKKLLYTTDSNSFFRLQQAVVSCQVLPLFFLYFYPHTSGKENLFILCCNLQKLKAIGFHWSPFLRISPASFGVRLFSLHPFLVPGIYYVNIIHPYLKCLLSNVAHSCTTPLFL